MVQDSCIPYPVRRFAHEASSLVSPLFAEYGVFSGVLVVLRAIRIVDEGYELVEEGLLSHAETFAQAL